MAVIIYNYVDEDDDMNDDEEEEEEGISVIVAQLFATF